MAGWLPAGPASFWSSLMMAVLSAVVRVGVARMESSLASLATASLRVFMALEMGSRLDILTPAVY